MVDKKYVASLFRASTLRNIANHGYDPHVRNCAIEFGTSTLRETLQAAYAQMRKDFVIEYVLKNELIKWLLRQDGIRYIRTEYYVGGKSIGSGHIADVIAIVKNTATAYEIKSKYDSPRKLKQQVEDYSLAFDRVVLVTESGHSNRFYKKIPSHVGLSVLDRDGIRVVEEPDRFTQNLSKSAMLNGLYKKEKIRFVKRVMPHAKYLASYYELRAKEAADTLTMEEMMDHFHDVLAYSTQPKRYLEFLPDLPDCLTAALYDYWLLAGMLKTLIALMDRPVQELF